jgi:hypothetical protein
LVCENRNKCGENGGCLSATANSGHHDSDEVLHCHEARQQHVAATVIVCDGGQVACFNTTV